MFETDIVGRDLSRFLRDKRYVLQPFLQVTRRPTLFSETTLDVYQCFDEVDEWRGYLFSISYRNTCSMPAIIQMEISYRAGPSSNPNASSCLTVNLTLVFSSGRWLKLSPPCPRPAEMDATSAGSCLDEYPLPRELAASSCLV